MSNKSAFISTSIGKKVLMSLTGLFLITFLLAHLVGNLQLFLPDEGESFNKYAVFMTTNPFIKTVSYLLYFTIIFHAVWGLLLTLKNKSARPVAYAKRNTKETSPFARNMGILGTIILVFIVVHMSDFWYEYKFGALPFVEYDGVQYKNLYLEVKEAFSNILYVVIYVISMIAISFHLWHGFQSAFQSLGLNHHKYTPVIEKVGYGFAIIVPFGFALIPIVFYLKSLSA